MLAYYSNINLKAVYGAIKNRPLGSFKDNFGVPSKFEKSFLVC